jgi:hypothetical protein
VGNSYLQKTQHPGRAFYLIIKIPSMDIIDAVISFNLAKAMGLKESIGVKDIPSIARQP